MDSCSTDRYCSLRPCGEDLDRDQMKLTIVFGILENLIGLLGVLIAVVVGISQARYFRRLNRASNIGAIEEGTPDLSSRTNNTLQ
jgi:hypothetical protein